MRLWISSSINRVLHERHPEPEVGEAIWFAKYWIYLCTYHIRSDRKLFGLSPLKVPICRSLAHAMLCPFKNSNSILAMPYLGCLPWGFQVQALLCLYNNIALLPDGSCERDADVGLDDKSLAHKRGLHFLRSDHDVECLGVGKSYWSSRYDWSSFCAYAPKQYDQWETWPRARSLIQSTGVAPVSRMLSKWQVKHYSPSMPYLRILQDSATLETSFDVRLYTSCIT